MRLSGTTRATFGLARTLESREQHVHLGLAIAERGHVLSHGTLALAAPTAELRDNISLLQASYVGEGNDCVARTDRRSP